MKSETEKGSIAIAAAFVMIFMMILFTAVMSHAQLVAGHTRTREAASNVARSAAQEIDWEQSQKQGKTVLNEEQALFAAKKLMQRYPEMKLESFAVVDGRVQVEVSTFVETAVRDETISSTSSAAPIQAGQ